MIKIIILLLLLSLSLFSKKFHFTEERYSCAIDKSILLQGDISFLDNTLLIKYDNSDKSLLYTNNKLTYTVDKEITTLDSVQENRLIIFFKVLLMIYNQDAQYKEAFEITTANSSEILKPKTIMKKYISEIVLYRDEKKIKEIKLFLNNNDFIKIVIDNEIY